MVETFPTTRLTDGERGDGWRMCDAKKCERAKAAKLVEGTPHAHKSRNPVAREGC